MADERVALVTSAFKPDDVRVQSMEGAEELGRPFKFTVELLSKKHDLKLDDQLGKELTVSIELPDNKKRHFSGLVSQIAYAGVRFEQHRYVAEVRPWIWFLGFSSDNRIFQEKAVPEILTEVFQEHGQSCKKNLSGKYEKREYCVQYGETDLNFASRLMEEEGLYYFFEHSKGKHEMILADAPGAHKEFPGYAKIPFFPPDPSNRREEDHIDFWEMKHQVETQVAVVESYNYETPKSDLLNKTTLKKQHGESGHELYEYGKLSPTAGDTQKASKVRAEEQQAAYQIASGGGNVMGISAGCTFELTGHDARPDQNGKYLVISSGYNLENNEMAMAGGGGGGASFHCYFNAIPDKTQFRAQAITSKARVQGPQTAVVVGPSGDEIYTDKYGRIKVQFHWDRLGKGDEKSGCWIRVSTGMAGQNWGMVAIPRIGQEVIVDFLEGDPDQPIVVGSVYNADNMPPYDLPANMTQSGFKSRSTKKGDPKTFNEIRFEDKKGAEEIYVHAERNYTRVVENDDVLKIGLDDKDKGDQTIEIYNDRTATLKEGTDSLKVEKGDQMIDVKKTIDIKAGDQLKITVGQSSLVMKKDGTITINGKDLKLDFKMDIKTKAGKDMKVESGVGMDLKTGVGMGLKAAQIKIAGSATLDLKGGAMTTVKGAMVDVNGSAMAKLKGALTMIG